MIVRIAHIPGVRLVSLFDLEVLHTNLILQFWGQNIYYMVSPDCDFPRQAVTKR
jgi:hypothetical protein